MSHFTVLVPAENELHLEQVLMPYHEYECTGIEAYTEFVVEYPAVEAEQAAIEIVSKDYVQNDEVLKEKYEGYLAEGDLASIFDDWSGLIFDEQGNVGRLTNPNAKWDWWLVGGRWTGKLILKEPAPDGAYSGKPGLMTSANTDPRRADSAYVKDVDWNAIHAERIGRVMGKYDTYHQCLDEVLEVGGASPSHKEKAAKAWNDDGGRGEICRKAFDTIDDYALSLAVDDLAYERGHHWFDTFQESADIHYKSREEYAAMFGKEAVTYAFIDTGGNWNQRGEMGWWGMDDKEKGTPDYDAVFWKFVESLEPEQRIYIVDCHI